MEKINLVEMLKDCPSGMELDCTIWDNVVFDHIDMKSNYPIYIKKMGGEKEYLTENGCFNFDLGAKCVIFPKGKSTWEGFQRPFKDGDILFVKSAYNWIFIYKESENNENLYKYAAMLGSSHSRIIHDNYPLCCKEDVSKIRFATEEEKEKLFKAIKDNGYKWNPETKTLEKLIEPKFKVGDRIRFKTNIKKGKAVTEVKDTHYILDDELALPFTSQDNYELAPDKFDISNLKPFDKVLVRHNVYGKWGIDFFGYYNKGNHRTTGSCIYKQCVPYEGNEHLLGTTNDCNEYFKTWE